MAFADLPQRILLPAIICVAVVLGLLCIAVWIVLNPREKTHEVSETPFPAPIPLEISIDSKDFSAADGMV
jgi:hypothetical protein